MKKLKITIYSLAIILIASSCIPNQKSKESEDQLEINEITADTISEDSLVDQTLIVSEAQDSDKPYTSVEQMPQFVGGDTALIKFVKENLKYPEEDTQGRVVIRFVVDQNGDIQEPTVVRSLSAATDKEALRVIKAMPQWIPGKQKGRTVSVYYTIPIRFQK